MEEKNNTFSVLSKVNVNDKVEKKQKLSYLSWSWAWSKVKEKYPEASYQIWKDEKGNPYTFNETLGYMCYTTVCVDGETLEMWLPVMNGANKAMLNNIYTYKVKMYEGVYPNKKFKGNYEDKEVEAATMFDINKTIMRCLVKNLAMFGLGLYIYAGEDLPEEEEAEVKAKAEIKTPVKKEEIYTLTTTDVDDWNGKIYERDVVYIGNVKKTISKDQIKKLKGLPNFIKS